MDKPNFVWDKEKIMDFKKLSKEEFLKSYSYLTEEEYDNTAEILTPNMWLFVKKLLNSSVPYGKITVKCVEGSRKLYAIFIDGELYSTSLDYYEAMTRIISLDKGYGMCTQEKRKDVLNDRKRYIDMFWKYLDAASPEIMAGYFLFDYGDEAYSRWMECAEEFEPAEREIITNIISKLGRED